MPNIITPSYFVDRAELEIPNAISGNAGEGINRRLQILIDKYERMMLLELLGKDQYNHLQEELELLPFNPEAITAAQPATIELVNGMDDWQGLSTVLGLFIYCAWMRSDEIKVGTVGSGKGQKEGFTIASRAGEYAERWNDFIIELAAALDYLEDSEYFEVNPEFPLYKYGTINSLGI